MKKIAGKLAIVVLPILAALWLLYPTYESYQLNKKKDAAINRASQADSRADSLQIMDTFRNTYGQELDQVKEQQLKLGLDLQGGMYVTLEVDVVKLIEESAQREAVDEIFESVIAKTEEDLKESDEPALEVFPDNFEEIAEPQGRSLIYYFDIGDVRDMSEEAVIEKLQTNADEAINQAQEVIRQRIDKYGVSEPNIQKQGNRRIILELPGVSNEQEMRQLIQTTARLEFKLVRNNAEIVRAFDKINRFLAGKDIQVGQADTAVTEVIPEDTTAIAQADTAVAVAGDTSAVAQADTGAATGEGDTAGPASVYEGLEGDALSAAYWKDHKFTSLFGTWFVPGERQQVQAVDYTQQSFPEGQYMFRISKDSIAKMMEFLDRPEIRPLIPYELEVTIGAKADTRTMQQGGGEIYDMYSVKREPELTGDVVTDARATFDPTSNVPMVLMEMNSEGSERWARITGANVGNQVAIVLDGRVYSAPVVRDRISGGSSQITGMENVDEASLLEIVLKAGALKAPVRIIEERVVGPSLGADSIRSGLTASLIAVFLVILYMIMYYGRGGVVADIAVLMNVLLVLAILSAFGGTLTLPGIAGIILTIGMAVDANVLIFERIREELAKGRSLRSAIDEGFSKALSAIFDSNITTFLTALILFYFGSGPIQGFAMTLMIGILGTLFTGIVVTRAIIEMFMSNGSESFSFGQPKVAVENR